MRVLATILPAFGGDWGGWQKRELASATPHSSQRDCVAFLVVGCFPEQCYEDCVPVMLRPEPGRRGDRYRGRLQHTSDDWVVLASVVLR